VDRDPHGEVLARYQVVFGAARVDDSFYGTDDAVERYVRSLPDVSDAEINALPKS
jgi:hypothetical protein